jgi:excisionase family DNA binding protein
VDKLLLNDTEACQRIGVGRTFLWKLMSAGEIRSIKLGRRRLIPAASLVEYVERLTREAGMAER